MADGCHVGGVLEESIVSAAHSLQSIQPNTQPKHGLESLLDKTPKAYTLLNMTQCTEHTTLLRFGHDT